MCFVNPNGMVFHVYKNFIVVYNVYYLSFFINHMVKTNEGEPTVYEV